MNRQIAAQRIRQHLERRLSQILDCKREELPSMKLGTIQSRRSPPGHRPAETRNEQVHAVGGADTVIQRHLSGAVRRSTAPIRG